MAFLIVARHQGLVQWLERKGIVGEVIAHVADPKILEGKHIYGVLPLSLACLCESVTEVALPGLRPEQRGKELSPDEMDAAGAHLVAYQVSRV